jgi:hypothetical protein
MNHGSLSSCICRASVTPRRAASAATARATLMRCSSLCSIALLLSCSCFSLRCSCRVSSLSGSRLGCTAGSLLKVCPVRALWLLKLRARAVTVHSVHSHHNNTGKRCLATVQRCNNEWNGTQLLQQYCLSHKRTTTSLAQLHKQQLYKLTFTFEAPQC